jgi:hypothetical protein
MTKGFYLSFTAKGAKETRKGRKDLILSTLTLRFSAFPLRTLR